MRIALMMQIITWITIGISLLWPAPANPGDAKRIMAEDQSYRVEMAGPGEPWYDPVTGGRVKFTFNVTDKASARPYAMDLDNLTARVDHIRVIGAKLLVFGEEATQHASVVTIMDLGSQKEIDSIMGFGHKLSETGRFISLRKFYSPQSAEPPKMSDLVLIYDLDHSADANRLRGEESYKNDPIGRLTEVGYPVYPEANAGKKHYRVWVRDEDGRHSIVPNGFFWLDRDRKLAFGDHVGGEYYLIVVDISGGLNSPVILKKRMDLQPLLGAEDRRNDAGLSSQRDLRLESVDSLNNGRLRVRIASGAHPQSNDLTFSWDEFESASVLPSRTGPSETQDPIR